MSSEQAATVRLKGYRLEIHETPWRYAETNAAAIDAHWQQATRHNPNLFNGNVFILRDATISANRLIGTYVPTTFAAYLHWRDNNFHPDHGRDGFACAIVTSADGHVLLAEATAGTLNDGLHIFPGGLIDRRDVADDRTIDIHAAARRELAEETGLRDADVKPRANLYAAFCGPLVAMGVPFASHFTASELKDRIRRHLASQDQPELIEPMFAPPADICARSDTPDFVRRLLTCMSDQPDQD